MSSQLNGKSKEENGVSKEVNGESETENGELKEMNGDQHHRNGNDPGLTNGETKLLEMSNGLSSSLHPKKLILYFDIRNTILVADSVTNITLEECLNRLGLNQLIRSFSSFKIAINVCIE